MARVSHNKSRRTNQENALTLRTTTPSYIPRLLMEPEDMTTVVEESSITLTSDASGNLAVKTPVTLAIASAFATQWLTIYDEWRYLQVQFRWHSRSSTAATGALCMYIERDNTDAVVTTLAQAYRQQESVEFRPYDDFTISPKLTTLQWKPKDPVDRQFTALATTVFFDLDIVGQNLPVSTVIGSVQIVSRIQFRGRTPA